MTIIGLMIAIFVFMLYWHGFTYDGTHYKLTVGEEKGLHLKQAKIGDDDE